MTVDQPCPEVDRVELDRDVFVSKVLELSPSDRERLLVLMDLMVRRQDFVRQLDGACVRVPAGVQEGVDRAQAALDATFGGGDTEATRLACEGLIEALKVWYAAVMELLDQELER